MVSRETEKQPAVQQLAAVAELLPGSCHEINNALTSIIGITDFLIDEASDTNREELAALKQKAERVAWVVGNLQNLAQTRPETRRRADVHDLLTTALDLRAYELKAGGIEVVTRFSDGLPPVLVAENRLRLVFLSIIVNAEHAIAEAAGAAGEGNLTVTTESGDGTVRVAIADDGPGLAEDGRGIGLSVAGTIVAEHGGRIDVESAPGGGAVFVVELPVAAPEDQSWQAKFQ